MRTLLFVLLVLAPLGADTYLVCAGVESYDDPAIAPLRFAAADVTSFADAFRAAGVPDRNITVLTTNQSDRLKRPTKFAILRAIQSCREKAVGDDTLLFFFAGHGMEQDRVPYLLTSDSLREELQGTALPMPMVQSILSAFQAKNVLFIIDACRNDPDAGRAEADAKLGDDFARGLRPKLDLEKQQAIAALLLACDVGQRAWEMPEAGHGAFTNYLLLGLAGEARAADGSVTLQSLADYVLQAVPAWAQRAKREQTPRFDNPSGRDFVVLVPPADDSAATAAGPAGPHGPAVDMLRRDGTLELRTNLPRVTIEINGQPFGDIAPGRPLKHIRLIGAATLRAAAVGCVPLERLVEVKLNQTVVVDLNPLALPSLTVTSAVAGALVTIDGVPHGAVGGVVSGLTVGQHTVLVSATGMHPVEQTVTLRAGQNETIAIDPVALPTLTIEVEEDGVEVELDGQPVGVLSPATPAVVKQLTVGKHLLVARKGGQVQRQEVTLEADKTETVVAWQNRSRPMPTPRPQPGPTPTPGRGGKPANWPSYLSSFTPPAGMSWTSYRVSSKDGMPQVLIPAGEFVMGTTPEQLQAALKIEGMKAEHVEDEQPAKRVYVSAYWMDLHEVTMEQYRQFRQETSRVERHSSFTYVPQNPKLDVSWEDATAYAEWAGRQLPTEAQWEKAARGGTTTAFPWGDTFDTAKANNGPFPKPVGSYAPNPLGLFDMIGNALEWCRDWYADDWYRKMPARDPENSTQGNDVRVLRGGSWYLIRPPKITRVADRFAIRPAAHNAFAGIRCVSPAE